MFDTFSVVQKAADPAAAASLSSSNPTSEEDSGGGAGDDGASKSCVGAARIVAGPQKWLRTSRSHAPAQPLRRHPSTPTWRSAYSGWRLVAP